MDPLTIVGAASAAIALLEKLIPWIREMSNNGEITVEQQKKIADGLNRLRDSGAWSGPEWKPSDEG